MRANDEPAALAFSDGERACLRRFLARHGLAELDEVTRASSVLAMDDGEIDRVVGRACMRERELAGRAVWRPTRGARASGVFARLLLSIHWSDPDRDLGRAFDYAAVWIPSHACTVVAVAAEPRMAAEMTRADFGELALGAFGPATDFFDGVRAALVREWARFDGFVPRMAEFGLVDGPLARKWLEQVIRRS